MFPDGARDEPHPQGADVPEAQTRCSGARRSRVASAASDVGSIEQLGGYDVAPRPSRGTGTKTSSKLIFSKTIGLYFCFYHSETSTLCITTKLTCRYAANC